MLDEFSTYSTDFLDGTYDCVDRIVLNAYFRMGQTPGGFRTWWRRREGSDDTLDNNHLMRMAGRLSRRVRAHAKAQGIPVIDCSPGERKHELAEELLPQDPNFVGVFLILVGRAPGPIWEVGRSPKGKIVDIARKSPWPYGNHYAFQIMDPEWGHLTLKLCGHPPFGAQIMLNGHEYGAGQAKKAGLAFTKEGNCFTEISDTARLAKVADTWCSPDLIGRLIQVCERWIYSACLCFALDLAEPERSGFQYEYSVFQTEDRRNLLFTRGGAMEQIVQGVIDRTRRRLDVQTLKTIFGTKKRPTRRQGHPAPRCEIVVERPTSDLTVFRLHLGKLTVKLYTQGEHVLRIEVVVHNTPELRWGRALLKFSVIIARLQGIVTRFLNVLRGLDVASIRDAQLDTLPSASQVGQTRVGGIEINQPRLRAVLEAVIALAPAPSGFTSSDVALKVQAAAHTPYTPRQAAYDLKKLRGKQVVRRIGASRRYETVPDGLQAMAALLVLRDKVIKPVLAGAGKPRPGPKPKDQSPIDTHYETIQVEMRNLFQTIGIAA